MPKDVLYWEHSTEPSLVEFAAAFSSSDSRCLITYQCTLNSSNMSCLSWPEVISFDESTGNLSFLAETPTKVPIGTYKININAVGGGFGKVESSKLTWSITVKCA